MKELLDEIVKIYFDYPDLTITECINKAKKILGYPPFNTNHVWEEVKESVDFMTAFKAFREGKAISVEDGELTAGRFTYYPRTNERYVAFSEEDIANGKWYIED